MITAVNFVGLHELSSTNKHLWKSLVAEFIGVLFIVFIGCGSCVRGWEESDAPTTTQISLAFGLTVGAMVLCLGHVSGGHFNPAVTFACLVTGKCNFIRAVLYIFAQCTGGITGAAILKGFTPAGLHNNLGQTSINTMMSGAQGYGVEVFITSFLVLVVFAVTDEKRPSLHAMAPFAVGFTVTACHLFAIKYTGSSMNPARDIGPTIITGDFDYHWIYWLGPMTGGLIAGLVYTILFSAETLQPAPHCLSSSCSQTRSSIASLAGAGFIRKSRASRNSTADSIEPFANDNDEELTSNKPQHHGYATLALQESEKTSTLKHQDKNGGGGRRSRTASVADSQNSFSSLPDKSNVLDFIKH